MEETEINELTLPPAPAPLILIDDAQSYLREAGKWANFLGIMGFIGSAFMVLMGLFFSAFNSFIGRYQPQSALPSSFGGLMGIFYIIIAVFYFFGSLYTYQFGVYIKKGIDFKDSLEVSNALGKLKSMFKLVGITTVVSLCIYALVIIIVIIVAIIGVVAVHHNI